MKILVISRRLWTGSRIYMQGFIAAADRLNKATLDRLIEPLSLLRQKNYYLIGQLLSESINRPFVFRICSKIKTILSIKNFIARLTLEEFLFA